mgnify:CR=1 FL=1
MGCLRRIVCHVVGCASWKAVGWRGRRTPAKPWRAACVTPHTLPAITPCGDPVTCATVHGTECHLAVIKCQNREATVDPQHAPTATNTDPSPEDVEHAAASRKAAWRLLPILCLVYFMAFVDRTNVGLAKTSLEADVGISAAAFGAGADR